jgi:hypothetical protein
MSNVLLVTRIVFNFYVSHLILIIFMHPENYLIKFVPFHILSKDRSDKVSP